MAPTMSKNKKKNIQHLIQKKQQLQSLTGSHIELNFALPTNTSEKKELTSPDKNLPELTAYSPFGKEIKHTIISIAIILVLLGVAIYLDFKTSYFTTFGNWLYTVLRLKA